MLKEYKSGGGREEFEATEVEEERMKKQKKFALKVNGRLEHLERRVNAEVDHWSTSLLSWARQCSSFCPGLKATTLSSTIVTRALMAE
jgi:hypothetical protein